MVIEWDGNQKRSNFEATNMVMNAAATIVQRLWNYCNVLRDTTFLGRVFAGTLALHDPSDKPAEKLLERIRVQRAPSGTKSKQPTLPFADSSGTRRRKK